jgi:poly(A) polymerase
MSQTAQEKSALRIVKTLRAHGHEAFYAGGYVRDRLLGLHVKGDIDIATSARPSEIHALFRHVVDVGEQFGVVIVVEKEIPFEVATFRSDTGAPDGRHPETISFTDARTDALRRDFTVNGLFYDPVEDRTLDYVDGSADLRGSVLRAIGDPARRFSEDYLRLMRGVRFAAKLGFNIESKTWDAMVREAPNITRISSERIFQELDKMLRGHRADTAFRLLHRAGLLRHVLPEVAELEGIEQPVEFHPEGDVLAHTLLALSFLRSPTQCLAWSTLLHDIGKAATMSRKDRIRFNSHDHVGAQRARVILRRLKAPRRLITCVEQCIDNHMNFINVMKMRVSTLKRFLARRTIADELEMHRIDCLASHGDLQNYNFLKTALAQSASEAIRPRPLITGRDLIGLGLTPGPLFGRILDEVYDLQLEERVRTARAALDWVKRRYVSTERSQQRRKGERRTRRGGQRGGPQRKR